MLTRKKTFDYQNLGLFLTGETLMLRACARCTGWRSDGRCWDEFW